MRIFLLFCWAYFLLPLGLEAFNLLDNPPPGCDTLITTDGKMHLVHLEKQTKDEIRYTVCDSESGRLYVIKRDKIQAFRPYKKPPKPEKIIPIPEPLKTPDPLPVATSRYKFVKDTFDLLTLTNGKKFRVLILERDYFNTYYRLYDEPSDDRQYSVSNQQVQSVKIAKLHNKRHGKSGTKAVIIVALIVLLLVVL